MITVYRLNGWHNGVQLPLHWSYDVAWEYDPDTRRQRDLRYPGFQVWQDPARMAMAAANLDPNQDGDYPVNRYPHWLIITARALQYPPEAAGEWCSVRPEDVLALHSLPTEQVNDWVSQQSRARTDPGLVRWLRTHRAALERYLTSHAQPRPLTWIETLPHPDTLPRQRAGL